MYTYDDNLVSDFHKETYGYRPSADYMRAWAAMPQDEKQKEWDYLTESAEMEARMEAENFEAAAERFECRISGLMEDYNISRGTAIRWDMQANETGDVDFYGYINGLRSDYNSIIRGDLEK